MNTWSEISGEQTGGIHDQVIMNQNYQEEKMETYIVKINGTEYEVEIERKAGAVSGPGTTSNAPGSAQTSFAETSAAAPASPVGTGAGEPVVCGTAGKVWKIEKNTGEQVSKGDTLLILEAMKMEIPVVAPVDGTISAITVQEGDAVASGETVAFIE